MIFRKSRRKFKRISAHHLIKYRKIGDQQKTTVSFARNLSAGGVLLYLKNPEAVGDELELTINLPGSEKALIVRGRVLRSKELKKVGGFEVGIQFTDISKEDFELIQKKIEAITGS